MEDFVFCIALFGLLVGITGWFIMVFDYAHEEFVRCQKRRRNFGSNQRR